MRRTSVSPSVASAKLNASERAEDFDNRGIVKSSTLPTSGNRIVKTNRKAIEEPSAEDE
jgi:hypothetical protein